MGSGPLSEDDQGMDVIGFLAGLAADAISGSIIVSPVAVLVAVALVLALSTGLAARLVEAWEQWGGTRSTIRRRSAEHAPRT